MADLPVVIPHRTKTSASGGLYGPRWGGPAGDHRPIIEDKRSMDDGAQAARTTTHHPTFTSPAGLEKLTKS